METGLLRKGFGEYVCARRLRLDGKDDSTHSMEYLCAISKVGPNVKDDIALSDELPIKFESVLIIGRPPSNVTNSATVSQ